MSFCSASGVPNSLTESNAADTFKICQICLYSRPFFDILVILCAFLRMVAAFVQSELFVLKLDAEMPQRRHAPDHSKCDIVWTLITSHYTLQGHMSQHLVTASRECLQIARRSGVSSEQNTSQRHSSSYAAQGHASLAAAM